MKLSEIQSDAPQAMKLSQIPDMPPRAPGVSDEDVRRAQAAGEVVTGPPKELGNTGTLFNRKEAIEAQLRSEGKDIENDPQWREATKNLARSVSAGETNTAMWSAGGDLLPVAQGAKALFGKGTELAKSAYQGIKPAQQAVSNIGLASDRSVLGGKMFRDLKSRMDSLLKTRSAAEKSLRADYLAEGIPKEGEIATSYRDFLAEKFGQNQHPVQKKLIEESAKNVEGHPSIETLIIEKRRLEEIASGDMAEYGAVQKKLASELADGLVDVIKKEAPSYGKYLDKYAEMSSDINLFENHAIGQKVTKETSSFLPDVPKFDPADLPAKMFKSKYSIDILRKLSGGNEKMVSDAASEHVAGQLKNLNAMQARRWLDTNKKLGWLEEFPAIKSDAERYVANLEKVSHTSDRARKLISHAGAGAAGGLGVGGIYTGLHHFGVF